MQKIQKRREELENLLTRKQDSHSKKYTHVPSESEYRNSCKEMKEIYQELADICKELGDPIPVRI